MTPREFYKHYKEADADRIAFVCKTAGTSPANFYQIAMAGGSVGKALAKRLADASDGEMTVLEILFPEDYDQEAAA